MLAIIGLIINFKINNPHVVFFLRECIIKNLFITLHQRIVMSSELTIGHLTGSAQVTKNHLFSSEVIWRSPRTIGQMFFQPYEFNEEFIFCAQRTFLPMVNIGLAVLDPSVITTVPVMMGCLSAAFLAMSEISKFCGDESSASKFLDLAKVFIVDLCQSLIDLVVLPLSVLVMLTRGISTGLQAAGIVREHVGAPSA